MRIKTLPLKQYEREKRARLRNLNRYALDAYALTGNGKVQRYVFRLETFLTAMDLLADDPAASLIRSISVETRS